ncbi:helix-turn-helix transcriptional regulator [Streptomyces sp. NBC_01304]|uniref:helix-turn-helix transcriptional regulator n=1 Tax=Streptomyces sp. NBC_01304 TaxID=2903818 RepID=UPI002E157547|nr:AAA family ATPase [Streptomyces sp. NBC_01304]
MDALFVGREDSLARMNAAWDRAKGGQPQRVLVEGPPGIGKSALVRQFLRHTPKLLQAEGEETESGLAFGVLEQLCPRGGGWPDPPAAGAALIEVLDEAQGGETPVALVVDDAQWADHPSLQALTFALRRLRADKVLTIVVVRDAADVRLPEGLRRMFTADPAIRVRLEGLDAAELRLLSGELGTGKLTTRAATRLRGHTSGNPLHVQALLEQEGPTLLDALERSDVAPPAPKSFTALVLGRLAACGPEAAELVCAAGVLGMHCTLDEAFAVASGAEASEVVEAGAAPGEAVEAGVVPGGAVAALDQAVRLGLLAEGPGDPLIRFPHPLVHAAVYHQLGPARRAALHRRAAALAGDAEHRLRHLALAASGPDARLATELTALGRQFAVRGAWANASGRLAAAARLSATPQTYEQNRLEAVECGVLAGEVPDVGEVAQEIASFAPSGWRSYLLGRLSLFDLDRAEALLTDAWHRCDPDAEPLLGARIAGQFAALYGSMTRGAEMAEWAQLALRLAPDDTATDMIRYLALTGRAMNGEAPQALAELAARGPLPDPAVADPAQLEELLGRGTLREFAGDATGAVRDLTGVFAHCHARAASFRVVAATGLASAEYRAGHWDDASVHADFALSLAADTDQPHVALYCRMLSALLHAARGDFAKAQAHSHVLAEYARFGHLSPTLWAALAAAHLARARGDAEGVVLALDPLPGLTGRGDLEVPGGLPWTWLLADAWTATGEHQRAGEVLAPYEVRAAQSGHHGALLLAGRSRGILEAARGDQGAAERAFRSAARHAAKTDAPFDRALLHLAYGQFLRRSGKRGKAGDELRRARELLLRLDAGPDLERCGRELAACGLEPGERRPRDAALLTAQELAVARLVVAGLTNRQVARELVISVKTVEYHLGRIYTKFGIDSRTRLAARLEPRAEPEP